MAVSLSVAVGDSGNEFCYSTTEKVVKLKYSFKFHRRCTFFLFTRPKLKVSRDKYIFRDCNERYPP